MADGLYLYDAKVHVLKIVLKEDIRGLTGVQSFVRKAPVNIVYVADFDRAGRATDQEKIFYSAADTGFIAENVYLYCASEGLATVVRGMVDREALAKAIGLRPNQKVVLAQSVGYPQK
jgi:nitroreductase